MYLQQTKIRQKQSLRLALTPRLKQALQLLYLPLTELNTVLKKEVVENPLLEIDKLANLDTYKSESSQRQQSAKGEETKRRYLESILTDSPSLQECLLRQLNMFSRSENEQRIGETIIGNIDKNGYLRISLEEISQELVLPLRDIQKILSVIQGFFPLGVGARNLTECLIIQLKHKGQENSLTAKVIKAHLPDLEKRRFEKITKSLKIAMDELKNALAKIAHLEPKPGRSFAKEQTRYITADILLLPLKNGYKIELNNEAILPLYINPYYAKLLKSKTTTQETKKYLEEKLSQALWLIKAIERRQNTIKKVTNYIINVQKDFMDNGPAFIRPLTLTKVAKAVGINESTVSRAVTNKHINTHYGIFEMKRFFCAAVEQSDGKPISSENIKSRIKEFIDSENHAKPFNDEAIVKMLKAQGIDVARRTVTKYRKQAKIPSSNMRRQPA